MINRPLLDRLGADQPALDRSVLVQSHALIIGVGAYVHLPRLPAAVAEGARQLAEVLADPLQGGYPPEQVRLLLDGEATREAILEELSILRSLTSPGSTVLLYFAGHGGRAEGELGETFFFPAEADESSPDALRNSALSGIELAEALSELPTGRMLVLFDCCHSGGLDPGDAPRSLAGGVTGRYCQVLGAHRGRVILASAREEERSWLPPDDGLSYFTRHLLAAFRGGVTDAAGWVRAWDLFEYIQPRVTGDRSDQHPVFKGELEENFPIALSLGGRPGPSLQGAESHSFDAYLSYSDRDPDSAWVWEVLVPRLEAAGLSIAVSGDVEEPGVSRVVAVERGIRAARRTIVVLSQQYLEDDVTQFVDVLAQTMGLEEGSARLLPVRFGSIDHHRLPARLRMLVSLDLSHPRRGKRNFHRLVRALHSAVPSTSSVR